MFCFLLLLLPFYHLLLCVVSTAVGNLSCCCVCLLGVFLFPVLRSHFHVFVVITVVLFPSLRLVGRLSRMVGCHHC